MFIGNVFNILHMLLIFFPILIYFVNKKLLKGWLRYAILIALLTPLHWEFFNDECVWTIITRKLGGLEESESTSSFSEQYLKWLYKPLMTHIFKLKWDNDGINKMVYIHWIFNFILIWYYIFYRYC